MGVALSRHKYGSLTTTMVLAIAILSILDAYFTIYLVSKGARELNPVMNFYLAQGTLAFFCVKYFLTATSLFLTLSVIELFTKRVEIYSSIFFAISVLALTAVVQWEVYLIITN